MSEKLPAISICVPNLNTLPFLEERFKSIFDQTFQDWELLVYDSYSDDGAWEYIQEVAAKEPRMRAWQGPKEGTPGSWTPCLNQARGKYVYIATSDDDMATNCLEAMYAALESNPECGLAHCNLRAIDEDGNDLEEKNNWWRNQSLFAVSSGALIDKPHVRKAPYDGLLHLLGQTVYISITQLLIRRSLFEEVGMFTSKWGPPGDYLWDMKAGLLTDTVHVPDTWGGWRLHSGQATDASIAARPEYRERIEGMIAEGLEECMGRLEPALRDRLRSDLLPLISSERALEVALREEKSSWERRLSLVGGLVSGSKAIRRHVAARALGRPSWTEEGAEVVKKWVERGSEGPVFRAL